MQQRKLVVQDSRRGHRALSIRSRFATAHPCLPGLHGVAWQRWDPTSVHVLREVGTTSMNKTSVERLLKARSHQYQACMKACIRVCLPVYLPITFCTAHPEQRSRLDAPYFGGQDLPPDVVGQHNLAAIPLANPLAFNITVRSRSGDDGPLVDDGPHAAHRQCQPKRNQAAPARQRTSESGIATTASESSFGGSGTPDTAMAASSPSGTATIDV